MPNFTEASRVALHHIRGDNAVVYSATIDPTWGFNGTPHGGYILAVILRALTSFQHTTPLSPTPLDPSSSPPQPDPLSLSAQFLLPVTPGPVEVHVSIVRAGRTFTNLQAKLLHHTGGDNPGEVAVIVQAVFTRFPPVPAVDERGRHAPPSNGAMDLFPLSDSPYAEALKSPLLTHPSELMFDKSNKWDETGRRWSKESSLGSIKEGLWEWVADPRIEARRAGKGTEGRAVTLEWGGYTGMMDRADVVDLAVVAMTADVSASQPEVLPPAQRTNSPYFPTLTISLQFHAALPVTAPYLSDQYTLGVYSPGGSPIHQGRHEQRIEVWTAPSGVGQGAEQEGWRERSMLLCTSTQAALTAAGRKGGRL